MTLHLDGDVCNGRGVLHEGVCSCFEYFKGQNCSEIVHCFNNGEIVRQAIEYCQCPTFYYGDLCDSRCNHGIWNNSTARCDCIGEWFGNSCDEPTEEFAMQRNAVAVGAAITAVVLIMLAFLYIIFSNLYRGRRAFGNNRNSGRRPNPHSSSNELSTVTVTPPPDYKDVLYFKRYHPYKEQVDVDRRRVSVLAVPQLHAASGSVDSDLPTYFDAVIIGNDTLTQPDTSSSSSSSNRRHSLDGCITLAVVRDTRTTKSMRLKNIRNTAVQPI